MKDFPQTLAQSVLRPGGLIILGVTGDMDLNLYNQITKAITRALPDACGALVIPSKVPCLFIINVEPAP